MVRLKERMPRPIRRSPRYFNSTMVRLKAAEAASNVAKQSNFNSTMVRLKDDGRPAQYAGLQDISIPLWYD